MVQIVAKEFLSFIEIGATRPFVIRDHDGLKWVVKALGNPFGTQAVFNEHVAGGLARLIDLPWPTTSLITLSPVVINALADRNFKVTSSVAVGGECIHGLSPIEPAGNCSDSDFSSNNSQYIRNIFPTTLQAFYGKSIFDNWILMKDTKSDTLHVRPDGSPVFLDATFAFGFIHEGEGWDIGKLFWDEADFNLDSSSYMRGVVVDSGGYDPWIERIQHVKKEQIKSLLDLVPKDWKVPTNYIHALEDFLGRTSVDFLPRFQEYLGYLNFINIR